jgi:hypothetical protein
VEWAYSQRDAPKIKSRQQETNDKQKTAKNAKQQTNSKNNMNIPGKQLISQLNWLYATKQFDPARKISAQDKGSMRTVRMSHREGHGAPDRTPATSRGSLGKPRHRGTRDDLWRTGADRALARLQRDLPATLAHCAGTSHVAPTADTITLDAG